LKLVQLIWVDSHSPAIYPWVNEEQINHGLHKIKTVGWVINESKHSITVASSLSGKGSKEVGGVISIPKGAIVKRKNL